MKKTVLLSMLTLFLFMLSACGPKTYEVTIDYMNGTPSEIIKLEEGKRVPVPQDPSYEGYVFGGWFSDIDDQQFSFNTKVAQSFTIYAKWNLQTYTIKFASNGGSIIEDQIVEHGMFVIKPEDPTRAHYTFVEWLADDQPYDFSTPVTSNLILYADYEAIYHNVLFDSAGGTAINTQSVMDGSMATIPAEPTKDGFTFDGWYLGSEPFDFSTRITSLTLLTAKWQENMYSGYYEGMDGLTGTNLIIFLNALLEEMNGRDYEFAKIAIPVSDRDPNNPSNIVEFYTGESRQGAWSSGGTIWNREHVWPQSLLNESAGSTVNSASDLHNLKPSDPNINSSRGNKWFGPVNGTESYLPERTDIRGDIARILFYMDIRYDNLKLVALSGNQVPAKYQMGDLNTLLLWHVQDPVDAFELNRNNVIYGYQGNRNPFIDHPELVGYIYN